MDFCRGFGDCFVVVKIDLRHYHLSFINYHLFTVIVTVVL